MRRLFKGYKDFEDAQELIVGRGEFYHVMSNTRRCLEGIRKGAPDVEMYLALESVLNKIIDIAKTADRVGED